MNPLFVPYAAIEHHGVIGDRRTAALVAGDGTIDWHCVPDYDGDPVFGCLLDAKKCGFWRFGPERPILGKQRYLPGTAVLLTEWQNETGTLELCDTMLWPGDDRPSGCEPARIILRRLRCSSGHATVAFHLRPSHGFGTGQAVIHQTGDSFLLRLPDRTFGMWSSFSVKEEGFSLTAAMEMAEGEVLWAVFGLNQDQVAGGVGRLETMLEETIAYWRNWSGGLFPGAPGRHSIERSAITVHLLTYAPAGSAVAAVTTSLPERIGGDWNADYRFAWVRDCSLSLALLALLGKGSEVEKYLDWLSQRDSVTDAPLQVTYHVDGRTNLDPHEFRDLDGYRESRPVRSGNHAYLQRQHGGVGYLADCALLYLDNDGRWKEEYWHLIRRIADYSAKIWGEPDNGIWELSESCHWVASKVMSWVVLDRAIRIAEKVGRAAEAASWQSSSEEIRREVLEKGWSDSAQSFRQHYGTEEVDGSLLLIPVMGFLSADHPRVASTVRRIEQELTINGFVHRFRPETTPGVMSKLPLGVYEGAFFPTTFWLATTYAKAGRPDRAEGILRRCEALAAGTGLFPEGIDAATESFRGNTPLLFSQVEYARAQLSLHHCYKKMKDASRDRD